MAYTYNGDTRLHYEAHGEGPPLALLMGLGGTVQAWGLQLPTLARRYRVIAMDNRGAGRSDKPDSDYSIALFADDLAAVLDAEGIAAAHVLGVSMGGLIAQEFHQRHAERTTTLVLGCTGPGVNDPNFVPAPPEIQAVLEMDRRMESAETVIQAMVEAFYHPHYRERVPDLADRLLRFEREQPQPPHGYHRQLRAVLEHAPDPTRLDEINVPTLVLHGADDEVWPVDNAHYLADRIPGARLHVIPGAGHMFMVEQPRAFNAAVLEFLEEQGN
jgi:pimeloyl-ACP methyl ester carboxylesterase